MNRAFRAIDELRLDLGPPARELLMLVWSQRSNLETTDPLAPRLELGLGSCSIAVLFDRVVVFAP
jgi:hypothetical protein